MKTNKKVLIVGVFALAFAFTVSPSLVSADFSQISGSSTMTVGSRGENVRSLQKFISSNVDMYPSGVQDGNFGLQTKNGVIQFQLAYNLAADGIVGTSTRNKINTVITAGRGIDVSGPMINNLAVTISGRNATISFNTNEPVKTTAFFDTNSINWSNWDDSVTSLAIPAISGMQNTDSNFSTSKQIVLTNLSANTNYNYTVTATDPSGNISVVWPKVFRTAQ